MAKKKTTTKKIKPARVTDRITAGKSIDELSFFECEELKREIDREAAINQGVLTDDQVVTLVEAQTASVNRLVRLCRFMKLLEAKADVCKKRKAEINETQKAAESLYNRIADRLAVFIDAQGKSYHAGEFHLATRVSTRTKIEKDFDNPMYCKREVIFTPLADVIKKSLKEGRIVEGARLEEILNLIIK